MHVAFDTPSRCFIFVYRIHVSSTLCIVQSVLSIICIVWAQTTIAKSPILSHAQNGPGLVEL